MKIYQPKNFVVVSIICLALGISVAFVFFKVPSILPTICDEFGVDNSTASNLMSAYTFSSFIVAIPCGLICKKIGTKNALMISIIACIIGSVIGAFAKYFGDLAFPMLMFSRILEGTSNVFVCVCIPIMIMRVVDSKYTGVSVGIFAIWMSVGSIISQTFTPNIVKSLGFTGTWLIYALIMAFAALLVWFFVGGNTEMRHLNESNDNNKSSQSTNSSSDNSSKPIVISIIIFSFYYVVMCITQTSTLNFMPSGLEMYSGISGATAGLLTTVPSFFTIIAQICIGALYDKIKGYKVILLVCMIGQAVGIFLLFESYGPVGYFSGAVISGLCYGMFALGSIVTEDLFGRKNLELGLSIIICIGGLGQFLGSSAALAILGPDMANFTLEGFVLGAVCVIAAIGVIFIKPRYLQK